MSHVIMPDVSTLLCLVNANTEGRKALANYIHETSIVERIAENAILRNDLEVYDLCLQAINSNYPVETLNELLVLLDARNGE